MLWVIFQCVTRYHLGRLKQKICEIRDRLCFEIKKIIGSQLAGESVTKTAEMFNVLRTTVYMVMTAYTKQGKISSARRNSGRNLKLTDRDRRIFKRIVARK